MKILGIVTVVHITICLCPFVSPQKWHPSFERGFSDQYRSESTLGDYAFGYNEDHTSGGSFRREASDRHGNKIGSYGLRITDGRVRVVNYIADHNGYRADIVSNEPGIYNQNSNGFFAVNKKSIQGILIPGFSYSSDPPHVTFDSGNIDEGKEHSIGSQHSDMIAPLPTSQQISAYAIANEIVDESPLSTSTQDSNTSSESRMLGSVGDRIDPQSEAQTLNEVIEAADDETAQMENQIKASHNEDSSMVLQETKNLTEFLSDV